MANISSITTCTGASGPPQGDVFVGVDGCRAGWIAVSLDQEDRFQCRVWPEIASLWQALGPRAVRMLVDMPMGLPDNQTPTRQCDKEARKLLGPRASSVFPVPCRKALEAEDYATSCDVNQQETGRRLSKQTYNISTKIRELDQLLRIDPAAREILLEAHPELAFAAMGGAPRPENKKTHAGHQDRVALLLNLYAPTLELLAAAACSFPSSKVARDDVVDALALALSARNGHLLSLPAEPERDGADIPMAIWYARWNTANP